MQVNVSSTVMTLLAALAASIQFVGEQSDVILSPTVSLILKALAIFITVYLGKTNIGTYHQVPGTARRPKPEKPPVIVKP